MMGRKWSADPTFLGGTVVIVFEKGVGVVSASDRCPENLSDCPREALKITFFYENVSLDIHKVP